VREFFDTSVLVAAFWRAHVHHDASIKLLAAADKERSACSIHSLAELYATMSALPVKPMIPTEQVLLFIEEVQARLTLVSLDASEYAETIRSAAGQAVTGGRIYDALLLRCAAKCRAETIYTWNLKHFRAVAAGLTEQIRTP
jgi:predicted nucleic acid-binding protein